MDRKIYQELLNWKNTNIKKTLMIIGARQIGKTYIINEFCKKEFKEYIYINLLEQTEIVKIFKEEINTAENYVATQLVANNIPLIYWESGNQAEVDFILYNDDGIIPIEVKANDNIGSQSLNVYMKRYQPKYAIRISTKNFGFSNNIKSIPLYATFCID